LRIENSLCLILATICLEIALFAHRVTRITGCYGIESESASAFWLLADSGLTCCAGPEFSQPTGGEKVNEIENRPEETSNNQILFPMAVGVLFLAVLVAGALLG